jgi:MYXO-CTERM domain-containing protein
MTVRLQAPGVSLALVLGLAPLIGCGAPDDDTPEVVGTEEQAIKGGYTDDFDHAVVGIFDLDNYGTCSGSLIAPNLILTARHCVSNTLGEVNGGVSCDQTYFGGLGQPQDFYVTTLPEMTQNPDDYHRVREVVGVPADNSFCGNDQAILILDANVDPAEAIPLTPRVDSAIATNDPYYAVGFGATNDTGSGVGTRRRRDNLFIDCVADECSQYYTRPTEWVGDTGICGGDSGGPAIDLQNRVIGVTSRGPAGCEDPVYGYVYGWGQWIKDTAIHAAELGGYPPPAWALGAPTDPNFYAPVGQSCIEATECSTNACLNDGVASYCTRPCNDLAPCPEEYACAADIGVCKYVRAPEPPPEPKRRKAAAEPEASSCAMGSRPDPTKPIPWFAGAVALIGLAVARRRRPR